MLYFSPDGELIGKHGKLKPTGSERLIWGEGVGSTLPVFSTEFGKIGGLICWENYMPLARMSMYGQGVEIYLAPTANINTREALKTDALHQGLRMFLRPFRVPLKAPAADHRTGYAGSAARRIFAPAGQPDRCMPLTFSVSPTFRFSPVVPLTTSRT